MEKRIADINFTNGKKTDASFSAKALDGVLYSRVLKNGESIKTNSGKFYTLNEQSIEEIKSIIMLEAKSLKVNLNGRPIEAAISQIWQIEDPSNDKATSVGLTDLSKGDLVIAVTALKKDKDIIEKVSRLGVLYELNLNLFSRVKMRK